MNKKNETGCGYYRDSVRTSGEVRSEFVREKEVVCKLVLFIGAKVQFFLKNYSYFVFSNKILIDCCVFK
jgi:hypothetical protein